MKNIKEILKRNRAYIVIGLALCFVAILLNISLHFEKGEQENAQGGSELEIVDVIVNITCNEKDDDVEYNYVINPGYLSGANIPAVHIADVADGINKAFQKKEVFGEKLKIIKVWEKGTKVNFTVISFDNRIEVIGEYDRRSGKTSCE